MTFKQVLQSLMLVLGLSACASTEGFDQRAAALLGSTEDSIVATLGPPTETYEPKNSDKRYLSWAISVVNTTPGSGSASCYRGRCYSYYIPPSSYQLYCKLTYEFKDGRAISFNRVGNSCVAYKM